MNVPAKQRPSPNQPLTRPIGPGPRGSSPSRIGIGRVGLYVFAISAAAFFILPLYVMLVTSLKGMPEIRTGDIFALPLSPSFDAWVRAWVTACTGLNCQGISVGFWNSVRILVPSVVIPILLSAWTGYALSFWRAKGAELIFGVLLVGAFIPYQVFLYPMVRGLAAVGLFGSLGGIVTVHTIFALPVLTLLFRNFFVGLPIELFKAARIDGANFFQIFVFVMLPMATPMIAVAAIMQSTGVWNDFLFGSVFAGQDNIPMTVQLNNIVNSPFGEKEYNVNMAATIITALVPLAIFFLSGRWFVRGIAAGAIKG
jgi:glucose/mannose transport system permease protein